MDNFRVVANSRVDAVHTLLRGLRREHPDEKFIVGQSGFTVIWKTDDGLVSWTVMDRDYIDDCFLKAEDE